MTIRLIKKGAISKARKTPESKGLGDVNNPAVVHQLRDKHPAQTVEITSDIYDYQPEETLKLKLGKVLGKLDRNAAPGP